MKFTISISRGIGFYFGLGLCLLSCSEPNFKKYNELSELRVLALKADLPEVTAGATVTITPIVSDIVNSGALTFTANACLDPGVAFGARPTCEGSLSKQILATDQAITTLSAANSFTGAANSFSLVIPSAGVIFSGRSAIEQNNGISYLICFILNSADGRSVSTFRRIVVSTQAVKNTNPVVAGILVDGASFTFPFAKTVQLSANLTLGAESYQLQKADGSFIARTESLLTTWFLSDGSAKIYRTLGLESMEYVSAGLAPTGRKAYLIAITRDGRGGLDFKIEISP